MPCFLSQPRILSWLCCLLLTLPFALYVVQFSFSASSVSHPSNLLFLSGPSLVLVRLYDAITRCIFSRPSSLVLTCWRLQGSTGRAGQLGDEELDTVVVAATAAASAARAAGTSTVSLPSIMAMPQPFATASELQPFVCPDMYAPGAMQVKQENDSIGEPCLLSPTLKVANLIQSGDPHPDQSNAASTASDIPMPNSYHQSRRYVARDAPAGIPSI